MYRIDLKCNTNIIFNKFCTHINRALGPWNSETRKNIIYSNMFLMIQILYLVNGVYMLFSPQAVKMLQLFSHVIHGLVNSVTEERYELAIERRFLSH